MAEYNYTRYTIDFVVRDTRYVMTTKKKWAFRHTGVNEYLWKTFDTEDSAIEEMQGIKSPAPNGKFEIGRIIV